MTDDRSLERAARSWLEAGPTQAPDGAVEAALLRIETTTQERDLRVPWRTPKMNNPLRMAIGAAAVVAIVVLVVSIFPDLREPAMGGPGPSPLSSPPVSQSPVPSPAVLRPGPLPAGRYTTPAAFPVRITVTAPDGWAGVASSATVSILESGTAEVPAYMGFWIIQSAHRDPCGIGGGVDPLDGASVNELAASLAGASGFEATEPTDVIIDGVNGQYVELNGPQAGCTDPELFHTPDGSCRCLDTRVERNRLWILEVDGKTLVIDALDYPSSAGVTGTPATDLAELQGIVDSIKFSR